MKCVVCGKEIEESMYMDVILCSEKCFKKHFWQETLDDTAIIIGGECYHIGDENSTSYFRGMGGAKYTIKKKDGTIIHTTNLWHNGIIPKELYKGDNAEFVW